MIRPVLGGSTMPWRRLRWTWLSIAVLGAASVRTVASAPSPTCASEPELAQPAPERPAPHTVPRYHGKTHFVVSVDDDIVMVPGYAIDGVVGSRAEPIEVTALDGRTGALVRTRLEPSVLRGPDGWRWRFRDLR